VVDPPFELHFLLGFPSLIAQLVERGTVIAKLSRGPWFDPWSADFFSQIIYFRAAVI
jgi:hypothetical protein